MLNEDLIFLATMTVIFNWRVYQIEKRLPHVPGAIDAAAVRLWRLAWQK